jgi:hypothetical protein
MPELPHQAPHGDDSGQSPDLDWLASALDPTPTPPQSDSRSAAPRIPAEQFELLSAYLDDEVTPAERATVNQWLANDPAVRQLYANLTSVQTHTRRIPVPRSATSEEILSGVMQRLDRRRRRFWWVSGSAIAATITAVLTSLVGSVNAPAPQLASHRSPLSVATSLPESPTPEATETTEGDRPSLPASIVERALIID